MNTQKISFNGAYRANIEQLVINKPFFRPNTIINRDNTAQFYSAINPFNGNPDIHLFIPYNRAKVQLDYVRRPAVILTNDNLGQDAFNYKNNILDEYLNYQNKLENMHLVDLQREAQRVINEDDLNINLAEVEKFRPQPYHINPFETKSQNHKQCSIVEHIKMFLNDRFNTKMFEKEQKFYDELKIQFLKPQEFLSLVKKTGNQE